MEKIENSPLSDSSDPCEIGMTLAREVMSCLVLWICDAPTHLDRGVRATVAIYCVRPDLLGGATLEQIGQLTGRSRQNVHKLANSFRAAVGLSS